MTGKQLKNSILQLAIQGKLVPQDPNDETASVLLQHIRKEKEQLVKEGKLKKKDLVSEPIADEEKPFEIPESWEWCRLGEIITMLSGQDFEPSGYNDTSLGIPYITGASNLQNKKLIVNRWTPKPSVIAHEGDLLVVCKGSGVGKIAYCTEKEVHIARQIQCIRNTFGAITLGYIEAIVTYFLDDIVGQANGLIPGISRDILLQHILPLPPLSEQHRIVAKIEELMPLVEEYDKAQTKLNDLNEKLPDALKKSILQEAIQGKLVPQDPNDEPASKLMERIRKEKEQLVKEGKLKKKDLVSEPIADEEKPFEIPESWEWCRLGEICTFLSRGKSPKYSDVPNQYPVFAQKCNLKDGGISLEQARFLDPNTIDKWQEIYKLKTDDILVNSTGTGTVCRTRLFHENYLGQYPFTVPDSHVTVVRTFAEISSAFYYYIFNSKHIQDYWEERLAGSTNQKELYIGTIQETIIPLPPLSEQHRIVAKIEELFGTLK